MDSGLVDSQVPPPDSNGPVRVWLLLGKFGGDNAQVRGLGDHLARRFGWVCETRQVRFRLGDPVHPETLPQAIDVARSDSLAGPYPDVIISCSRFYGTLAAWLKRQSDRPMVHVHLGRIAAPMASFDLLAATAQYGLPAAPNFMPLTLPFTPQDPRRREVAIAAWHAKLAELPRPWSVLLAGGPLGLMPYDEAVADRIADQAIARVEASGGTLIAVVSRRTPGPVRRRIADRIAAAGISAWSVGWPAPEPNPYAALLAEGDRFLVTSDSASMIADACLTAKPVELIRLPITAFITRFSSRGLGLSLDVRRRRRGRAGKRPDLLDRLRDTLVEQYWMRPWDEIRDYLVRIERRGLLAPDAGALARQIQNDELDAMAARIAALVVAKSIAPVAHATASLVTAAA